jgi:hypothetical protein
LLFEKQRWIQVFEVPEAGLRMRETCGLFSESHHQTKCQRSNGK